MNAQTHLPSLPVTSRRRVLGGGLAGMGAAMLAGCGLGGGKAGPLRVAVTGKGSADVRLLFQAAGITPDIPIAYSEFDSGHLVVEAMNAGAIDLGLMSEIPPIFALAASVQNFVHIAIAHGDVNSQAVIVPKGSQIQRLADLKGKRIGYVRATTSQYFLIRMLQSVGLGWGDINPVAMNVSDGAAAFSQGALDAWAIYGFPIDQAIARDGARILRTATGILSGNYPVSAQKQALADPARVDQIVRFLKLQGRAYDWAAAHPAQWAPIVAGSIGVPLAYAQAEIARQSAPYQLRPVTPAAIASQQAVADTFADAHLIPHRVDVRPLWDARLNARIESA